MLSAGQRGEQEYILIRNKDEAPGGHRRSPEAREGRRKPQEAPGGPRGAPEGPQAPDKLASEKRAPRFSGSATFRKHVRGAKARATFRPFARGVRRVPFLPRILRRGRHDVHVERENIDFVLFFAG